MPRKFFVKIFIILLAIVLLMGVNSKALAQVFQPFSGTVLPMPLTGMCTCSGSFFIALSQPYAWYLGTYQAQFNLIFQPGLSQLFAWWLILVPSVNLLGDTTFPLPCITLKLLPTPVGPVPVCVPNVVPLSPIPPSTFSIFPALGTIWQVGTSL